MPDAVMKDTKSALQDLASEWRAARRVYAVYAAILKTFDTGLGPCKALESPIDRSDEKTLAEMRQWLAEMDDCCTAAHLRQIIQNSSLGTEPCLRSLIQRYLNKPEKKDEDRSKLDFLLAQYFAESASRAVSVGLVTLEDVARVLEPVIGESSLDPPRFLEPLKALIDHIENCRSLRELIQQGLLERGRDLKEQAGSMYFGPSALVSFTRYNFLLRRAFVRLLHADVEAIHIALRELEKSGANTVDCSSAGFTATEPIADLRRYCGSWRNSFVADYKSGPSFKDIVQIRAAVEAAAATARTEKKAAAVRAAASAPAQSPSSKITQKAEARVAPSPAPASAAPAPAPAKTVSTEVAHMEGARARVEATVQSKSPAHPSMGFDLQRATEMITRQVVAAKVEKSTPAVTVKLGETMVVLSSWELVAFTKTSDPISQVLRHAVVARTIVMESSERMKKKGKAPDLKRAVELGESAFTELQKHIAKAKAARNLDNAVNMAASAKRLTTAIEEAQKCLTVSS